MLKGDRLASILGGIIIIVAGLMVSPAGVAQNQTALLPPSNIATEDYTLTGKWLYCVTRGSGNTAETDLIISAINGTQSKILHQFRGRIFAISASFNPRYVTFTVANHNQYPLAYLLDLATSHIQLLTPYKANHLGASISPDGKSLLFSSDINGDIDIYQKSLGAHAKAEKIIPLTQQNDSNVVDSSINAPVNYSKSADFSPHWSPDGQSFIFVSDRQAVLRPQVYRYDLATGSTTWIDTKNDYATEAKFNPIGDKITLLNRTQGGIFDLTTKTLRKVNNEGLDEAPTFSPDGKFVAYSTGKSIVVIPEARIWEKSTLEETDKIVITPSLPKGVAGTIRRPIWLP